MPASALTLMASLDQGGWQVEQTRLSCQLRQAIPKYGEAVFEARAGGQPKFFLATKNNPMQAGPTQLVANAPFWNPELPPQELGGIEVGAGPRPVQLNAEWVQRLLDALNAGLALELARPAQTNGETPVRVALLPIRFNKSYARYRACVAQLLPVNAEQISTTVLEFGNQETQLSAAAKGKLDLLLHYAKSEGAAPVSIDAVSADTPRRLDNLALAKQRVQEVSNYLTSRGVAEARIKGNYRGERGRQKRAVVTVRLSVKE